MKTITLNNMQARLLASTIYELVNDDEQEYYLKNGAHPAYRRSTYLSEAHCFHLEEIRNKLEAHNDRRDGVRSMREGY